MKKTVLLTLFVISIFAASAQEKNTSASYIEKFKDNAIAIMHQSGVPASIVLGIAMHESGNGNSAIAQHLNNQFGMKGGGTSVYYKNKKKIHSAYKAYDSVLESFSDFARIMTEKPKFNHLAAELSPADYIGWVKGIQRSGYASSRKWGRQVLALIEKYQLHSYDKDSTQFGVTPVRDKQ